MKRFFPLLLAVFAIAAFVAPANAKWVNHEIYWQLSSQGSPRSATEIYVRDTSKVVLDAESGRVDTTGVFTLDNVDIVPRGMAQPVGAAIGGTSGESIAGSDTMSVAFLVFTVDSSAAGTSTLTGITAMIDGRVGSYGPTTVLSSGWVKADSAFVNGAAGKTYITGQNSFGIPIRSISPYGSIFRYSQLRARITVSAGILSGGVRAFLRYWKD